jgi:hypothetical protein
LRASCRTCFRGGAIVAVKVDLYSVLPLNSRSTGAKRWVLKASE